MAKTNSFKIILILLVHFFQITFAQKQNNQWRFGNAGGIDFNAVPPGFVGGAALSTGEGSASVADRSTGALLFYTDGLTVWNSQNQVMPNGTGLLGGLTLSSTTAAVIIPKPGSNSLYYIVTIDEQSNNNGVRYSIVDMALNGGLGDVVAGQKNILLVQTTSEKLEVVPASDGVSYWLITHDNPGNGFLSFKIDVNGFQTTPVVSLLGGIQGNGAGHMKINRQFNKIALGLLNLGAGSSTQIELFDFNNTTGVISNPKIWNYNFQVGLIYGVEFSPNGDVLYVSDLQQIVQYNIALPSIIDIENSAYQVTSGFYQAATLQLGIDNKIYINSGSVDAINCPNELGPSCGFQQNVIANQAGGAGYGLPKWVYFADDSPMPSSNSIHYADSCFGAAISFSLEDSSGITGVNWFFGDPNSGTNNTAAGLNVNHSFSQPGSFNISAIFTTPCGIDTLVLNNLEIINCNSPVDQCIVFEFTGSIQQWTVPSGVDTIFVKMWGAAGGGGPDTNNCAGGGGGFTETVIPVNTGQVIQIFVGEGGKAANAQTGGAGGWPNGGNGGSGNRIESIGPIGGSAGGGGRSEIRIGGISYAIAGGGGGAAYNRNGGAGGGLEAEYTVANNSFGGSGFGGTQTAGGAPAANTICGNPVSGNAGASLQGGNGANDFGGTSNDRTGGGGGGDGFFGGGGGSSHDGCFGVGSPGGGGSGFVCLTCPGVTGATLTQANFASPGFPANESDPLLSAYPNAAKGSNNQNGGNGLIQICYTSATCSTTTTTIVANACSSYTSPWGTSYNQTGTYADTLINSNGCDSIIQLNLTITGLPAVSVSSVSASCGLPNGTASVTATGGSGNYSFSWSNGAIGSFVTGLAAGSYSVVALDQNGCSSSSGFTIEGNLASPVSLVANDTLLEFGDSVSMQVLGANTFEWSPPNGLSCISCQSVIAAPFVSTNYQVSGTDSNGCAYLLKVNLFVEIELKEIFVPDAFSPNKDLINDTLFVRGSIKSFTFSVFNRWGEMVFSTNDQAIGWDGTFRGRELDPAIFVYYLEGIDIAGKAFERKGNITLIK